ncbi:hypothetical protein DUNSADRAFT_924 [Dunaliella salina]|uniref:Uncharacterized protein n=1 Tax=Dunaliella salina TaxID=3046 RepID=A0ABQ7H8R5_DUNSA|nr:hypothetical protein DUNSADRAFT_924 [Dunaliella salina]|eukprot:KAF5843248.1 hypothetical protein DUNSADRAFT_924 [Dunaliella salina]
MCLLQHHVWQIHSVVDPQCGRSRMWQIHNVSAAAPCLALSAFSLPWTFAALGLMPSAFFLAYTIVSTHILHIATPGLMLFAFFLAMDACSTWSSAVCHFLGMQNNIGMHVCTHCSTRSNAVCLFLAVDICSAWCNAFCLFLGVHNSSNAHLCALQHQV